MATVGSKQDGGPQGDKPPKEKTIPDGKPSADDLDASTRPPKRVHLFTEKSTPPDTPPKSNDEPLECSSFRPNTLIDSAHGADQAADIVGVRPPTITFKEKLVRFKSQMEKGKKAMYDAAMKAEDLEGMIQGLRRTRERIAQRRYLRDLQSAGQRKTCADCFS